MNVAVLWVFVMYVLLTFQESQDDKSTYVVKKIKEPIDITGRGDAKAWTEGVALTNFIYPWEKEKPPYTLFKSVHDKEWIYFLFDVEDRHINLYVKHNNKRDAVRSDRVELFFKQDDGMNPYYCLEIDALARVYDCKGTYYRKIDSQWSWPQGEMDIKSFQHENGYSVELRISKKSLKDLGLLRNNGLHTGVFRADCYELDEASSKYRWISWINPGSAEPDFHISSAFGRLELENH